MDKDTPAASERDGDPYLPFGRTRSVRVWLSCLNEWMKDKGFKVSDSTMRVVDRVVLEDGREHVISCP